MKLTTELEAEIKQVMDTFWHSYLKGDLKTWSSFLVDDYRNIGTTEEEIWNSKEEILKYSTAVIDQLTGIAEFRDKQTQIILMDPYFMVHELGNMYLKMDGEWIFYSKLRLSSVLQQKREGWRILHQHGSYPDAHSEQGETFGFRKLKEENTELREAVKRRTQELQLKNRELEIETALERVRSRSMAMHKSEELADLSLELVKQVQALGVATWFCAFNIYDDDPQGSVEWGSNGQGTFAQYRTPREGVFLRYINAGKRGDKLLVNEIGEEECPAHYEYLCTLPGVGEQLLKMKAAGIPFPTSQIDHVAYFKYGYVLFITYEPVPESHDVFIRFAKAFEQTYTRFLDLQKAEAQAKEAQIEASLERVRSVAMSMHKPGDLLFVSKALFTELKSLGFNEIRNALINTFNDEKSFFLDYDYSDVLGGHITAIPYDRHPLIQKHLKQIRKTSDAFAETVVTQKELESWIEGRRANGEPEDPQLQNISALYYYFYSTGPAAIGLSTYSALPFEKRQLLKRFRNVFELAYQRYADIQKAEEQSREAQIELALEKVRSHAMAMRTSDELNLLIGAVFTELTKLDLELTRCVILIYEGAEKGFRWWMANSEVPSMPMNFFVKYADLPFFNAYLEGWNNRKLKWQYILEGDNKIITDNFLFTRTELSQLPNFVVAGMRAPERVYLNASFNNFGNLTLASLAPLSDEHFDILLRFAKVFDLTYTRFNDLKQAEAQTKEAKIEASLERVRSKAMSMHTSQDLADTIGVFYTELKSFSITPRRCGVGLLDGEERIGELFTWNTTEEGDSLELVGRLRMEGHPVVEKVYNGWLTQTEYHPVLRGKEIKEYYSFLRPQIAFPDYEHDDVQYGYFFFFPEGGVYAWTNKEMEEEELTIYRRFTSVLSLTYKRYKDLQQAEELARQAQLDMIKLKEEKLKTENALAELQVTQKQLIQAEKMASLGELTAGIAHEIQNPLNFVNNFSEISNELIDEMKSELSGGHWQVVAEIADNIQQNLQKINYHGQRADAIVKGMLQHSRKNTGQKEPADLNLLVDEYLRLSYHGLRAKEKSFNAVIEMHLDPAIGKVNIIPQEIGRVLLNLFNNSFYAVNERKKTANGVFEPMVQVITQKLNNTVEIKVKDNGTGIPEKVVDKIFQPFFTTKPTGQGTGLGLSLSYDIIKSHGGELKVETMDGEGASFSILIPTE